MPRAFRELSGRCFVLSLGHLLLFECGSWFRTPGPDMQTAVASVLPSPAGAETRIALRIAQPARGALAAEFLSPQEVASAEKPRNRLSKGNDLIEGAMM